MKIASKIIGWIAGWDTKTIQTQSQKIEDLERLIAKFRETAPYSESNSANLKELQKVFIELSAQYTKTFSDVQIIERLLKAHDPSLPEGTSILQRVNKLIQGPDLSKVNKDDPLFRDYEYDAFSMGTFVDDYIEHHNGIIPNYSTSYEKTQWVILDLKRKLSYLLINQSKLQNTVYKEPIGDNIATNVPQEKL